MKTAMNRNATVKNIPIIKNIGIKYFCFSIILFTSIILITLMLQAILILQFSL